MVVGSFWKILGRIGLTQAIVLMSYSIGLLALLIFSNSAQIPILFVLGLLAALLAVMPAIVLSVLAFLLFRDRRALLCGALINLLCWGLRIPNSLPPTGEFASGFVVLLILSGVLGSLLLVVFWYRFRSPGIGMGFARD